ncbi:glycogen-binding subunit 76A [Anopheles nili]|uniref:glycogen-binding subunit 76A n=1 Tax=Anopheles nili TaxID=185578 RepID=UPI00237A419E|nr:glycogen-binding subunit 76A [Anopheles nili]
MTTPGDPSATGPDRPCGITSLLPIGMSCRSRVDAFARSLQTRLRNLGSQGGSGDDEDDEGRLTTTEQQQQLTENTWLSPANSSEQTSVTSLQPLRMVANEADSCFDFGLEVESPCSPVEECEYTRLIETATATPTGLPVAATAATVVDPVAQAPESGYVCSSPCSTPQGSAASSHSSSSDCQFYDPDSSDQEQRSVSGGEYYDCTIVPGSTAIGLRSIGTGPYALDGPANPAHFASPPTRDHKPHLTVDSPSAGEDTFVTFPTMNHTLNNPFTATSTSLPANGHVPGYTTASTLDSDSCSESLPPSQSTESNNSTFTGISSNSNSTLQDVTMEPLDEPTDTDVPDSAYCAQTRMGNGHAIMPRGTVINADTEIELMGHPYGLKYEEDTERQDETRREHQQSVYRGAAIEIEEVQKILEDCTMTAGRHLDGTGSGKQNDHGRDEDEDEDRKDHRRAVMSSGDEDEEESKPQRIRRCSSLKTGKTPPGTPGRRKVVRFADVLGLDLTDVRTFMDEVPKVPQSAYEDLTILQAVEQPVPEISLGPKADRVLVPLFQQPGALPCFLDRVREKQVNLENAAVTDPITLTITGTVRVRNLDFHKSVYVRYTLDNWRSYSDLQAVYAENSCDGFSDKFSFTLHGNSVQVGQRIEMAIRFHCRGEQFWDSNYDTNYVFQCLPITQPAPMIVARGQTNTPSVTEPAWCSSFY